MHIWYYTDINECEVGGPYVCHSDADCINTNGSFTCTCKEGFTGSGHYCIGEYYKSDDVHVSK